MGPIRPSEMYLKTVSIGLPFFLLLFKFSVPLIMPNYSRLLTLLWADWLKINGLKDEAISSSFMDSWWQDELSVILTRQTTCVSRPAQNTSPEAHFCDMKIDVLINVWAGQLQVVCMTSCAASGCTSACATRGKCTHNVACAFTFQPAGRAAHTKTRSTVELLRVVVVEMETQLWKSLIYLTWRRENDQSIMSESWTSG